MWRAGAERNSDEARNNDRFRYFPDFRASGGGVHQPPQETQSDPCRRDSRIREHNRDLGVDPAIHRSDVSHIAGMVYPLISRFARRPWFSGWFRTLPDIR